MRPGLPSKEECRQVSMALKHTETKNFITSNAVENILAAPKLFDQQLSEQVDACQLARRI